jgi:hypothetical protein
MAETAEPIRVHSLYVVQTQVLSLNDVPLSSTERRVRPCFGSLFSKRCFHRSDGLVYDPAIDRKLPAGPFLRNLGPLVLSIRRLPFLDSGERFRVGRFLSRHRISGELPEVFGFSPEVDDDRMSALHFELPRPLSLRAQTVPPSAAASGRIFVHLYPAGYCLLHVALSFSWAASPALEALPTYVRESRPWRGSSSWIWRTGKSSGTLSALIAKIKDDLRTGFVESTVTRLDETRWRTTAKVILVPPSAKTATSPADRDLLRCRTVARCILANEGGTEEEALPIKGPTWDRLLVTSKLGTVLACEPIRRKALSAEAAAEKSFSFRVTPTRAGRARDLFWTVMVFVEFVEMKNAIYAQYADFLGKTRADLKEYRLSLKARMTREDVFTFGVYNEDIPRYLAALDRYIRRVDPFNKRIYSALSRSSGFDQRRERVKGLLADWESEVAQWENPAVTFWKKVVSPIRSLLAK